MKYIVDNVGDYKNIYGDNYKFVIVKAAYKNEVQYIYMYPYFKDDADNIYKLDVSGIVLISELKDILLTKLKANELNSIKWDYKIKVDK